MSDIEKIKELRCKTGMSLADIKKAMDASGGDPEKASVWLRENLNAKFDKTRDTSEGTIQGYVHHNGQVATMVQLVCNTDFTARNDDFKKLAKDIALHVASARPVYVGVEDIPADILEAEKETLRAISRKEGKPEKILDKIIQGRLRKFYEEVCLMEQWFVKDPKTRIKGMVKEMAAKTQENVKIKRFMFWQIGVE
jgi:elongation factor Ts